MDLTVNLLTNHAYNSGAIRVFGGDQYRTNLHIQDMCRAYIEVLNQNPENIDGQVFNVGTDNFTVMQIAEKVKDIVQKKVELIVESSPDNRSYRISSDRIADRLAALDDAELCFETLKCLGEEIALHEGCGIAGRRALAGRLGLAANLHRQLGAQLGGAGWYVGQGDRFFEAG
jgi:nucleoside-diphosphate-sugar epimerase